PLTTPPLTTTQARGTQAPVTTPDDAFLTTLSDTVNRLHSTLTRFDQVSGDGDFGDNLAGGVRIARAARVPEGSANPGMLAAEEAFLDQVGGSSGPLFGLMFQQLRRALEAGGSTAEERVAAVRTGLRNAVEAVTRVGGAVPGDRTMIDPLAAAAAAAGSLGDVARAAVTNARSTAELTPRRGRASYVGARALGTPDPGAVGAAIVVAVLAATLDPTWDVDDLLGSWD
ncbi:MAG: DAK2 domain-containing protein, partial [Janthinobacterium lividum]